jgi:hypothetical protein
MDKNKKNLKNGDTYVSGALKNLLDEWLTDGQILAIKSFVTVLVDLDIERESALVSVDEFLQGLKPKIYPGQRLAIAQEIVRCVSLATYASAGEPIIGSVSLKTAS